MANRGKWLLCAAVLCLSGCSSGGTADPAVLSQESTSYVQSKEDSLTKEESSAESSADKEESSVVSQEAQPLSSEAQQLLDQMEAIALKNREPYRYTMGPDEFKALQEKLTGNFDAGEDKSIAARIMDEDLTVYREPKQAVTHEEAVLDVEFLFDFLKYGYSGYGYFGGDEVFHSLKQEIIAQLDASAEKELKIEEYRNIIADTLGTVIEDGHFSVSGRTMLRPNGYCYLSEELFFGKDEQGYFLLKTDETSSDSAGKTYFEGIGEGQIQMLQDAGLTAETIEALSNGGADSIVKPTLNKDGELSYILCLSSTKQIDEIELEVGFRDTSGNTYKNIKLNRARAENYLDEIRRARNEENQIYRLSEQDGVKIVEIRAFSSHADDGDPTQLEQFIEDAKSLRNEDYLILDLRGNSGGNSGYAKQWVQWMAYTANLDTALSATLISNTVVASITGDSYNFDYYRDMMAKSSGPKWEYFNISSQRQKVSTVSNHTKIFVLMDAAAASAAESFLDFLQILDNVYLVGTNTVGCCTFGNVRPVFLPNSGLQVSSSYNVNVRPDGGKFEGEGYKPDFWLDPNEGIERILKLINNLKS